MTIFGKKFDKGFKRLGKKVTHVARIGSKVYKGARKILAKADPYLAVGSMVLGGIAGGVASGGNPMGIFEGAMLGKKLYGQAKLGAKILDTSQRLIGDGVSGRHVDMSRLADDGLNIGIQGAMLYAGSKGNSAKISKTWGPNNTFAGIRGAGRSSGAIPTNYT